MSTPSGERDIPYVYQTHSSVPINPPPPPLLVTGQDSEVRDQLTSVCVVLIEFYTLSYYTEHFHQHDLQSGLARCRHLLVAVIEKASEVQIDMTANEKLEKQTILELPASKKGTKAHKTCYLNIISV